MVMTTGSCLSRTCDPISRTENFTTPGISALWQCLQRSKLRTHHPKPVTRPTSKTVSRDLPLAPALPPRIETTDDGRIVVVIEPAPGGESAVIDISSLEALGARVTAQSRHLLQVKIPPEMLHSPGDVYGVYFVRPPIRSLRQVAS